MLRSIPARATRRVALSALLLTAPLVLAGCESAPRIVAAPSVTGATATACATLLDALPEKLIGERQHSRTRGTQVQWGEPPLVLTCGVRTPAAITDFSPCSVMKGVQWFVPNGRSVEDPNATVTIHTLGTDPVVRVDVPAEDRPQFDGVADALGPALVRHLKVVNACE